MTDIAQLLDAVVADLIRTEQLAAQAARQAKVSRISVESIRDTVKGQS